MIFVILLLAVPVLWGGIVGYRAWAMAERLDHIIVEEGFTGPALILFGVPGGVAPEWSDAHNGWDLAIPTDTQILFSALPIDDKSVQTSIVMRQEDGTIVPLPVKTSTPERPYAFTGPRSSTIEVPLGGSDQAARFFAQSPLITCDPCPETTKLPRMSSRADVEAKAVAEIERRIEEGIIAVSALEVITY